MRTETHDPTLHDYASIGAAMQIDRIFGMLPILHRAVIATRPGKSVADTLTRVMHPEQANGGEPEAPRVLPDLEPPEVPPHTEHKTPKGRKHKRTVKHPRGQQRNPQTHRTPRKHAAPVLEQDQGERKHRRAMSRAARAAISARMRQYWATRGAARRAQA